MIAWVDGALVPASRARVSLLDRGHLLGDGVFETILVRHGHAFRASAHLDRLGEGLRAVGLPARTIDTAAQALTEVSAAIEDALVRVQVTAGDFQGVDDDGMPRVTAVSRPLPAPRPEVHLVSARHVKHTDDPLCGIKHTSFLPHLLARRAARAAGGHDALLRNEHGRAAEASTSNIMALHDGVLHAPGRSEGALDGVTRGIVLDIWRARGGMIQDALPLDVLAAASEVWLTNTSGGCVPVTRLDAAPVGGGKPGPVAAGLRADVAATVDAECA